MAVYSYRYCSVVVGVGVGVDCRRAPRYHLQQLLLLLLLPTLMLIVPNTCAVTSPKPELTTDSTNGTTNTYEISASTTPQIFLETQAHIAPTKSASEVTSNSILSASPPTMADADSTSVDATSAEQTTAEAITAETTVAEGSTTTPRSSVRGGEPGAEEYYSSYDYPEAASTNNNHTEITHKDPGVIPDPNIQDSDVDDEEVALPDDSLADTDLHDHDLIDSVMYIYFGSSPHEESGAGRPLLIAGAAISLMAQCFALASCVRRLRRRCEASSLIFLGTEGILTLSNLIFMLGVQDTGKPWTCAAVGYTLHYAYLVTSCRLFAISVYTYLRLRRHATANDDYRSLLWWPLTSAVPLVLVIACYKFNPAGYETRQYCWMSVERGMVLSFMVPISMLMVMNVVVTVLCQRLLNRNDVSKQFAIDGSDDVLRRALRSASVLLPLFAVSWFLRVVALENGDGVAAPVLAAVTDAIFNWYIFLRSHVLLPSSYIPESECEQDSVAQLHMETDAQPLISPEMSPIHIVAHHPRHSGGELMELRLDAISTITT